MDWGRVCPGCMKELSREEINGGNCPYCGFNSMLESRSYALPVRSILNGKYFIGKLVAVTEDIITYYAYDMNLESKVLIDELFPSSLLIREEGTCNAGLISEDKSEEFEKLLKEFAEAAKEKAHRKDEDSTETIREIFKENNTAYIVKVKKKTPYKNSMPIQRSQSPVQPAAGMPIQRAPGPAAGIPAQGVPFMAYNTPPAVKKKFNFIPVIIVIVALVAVIVAVIISL